MEWVESRDENDQQSTSNKHAHGTNGEKHNHLIGDGDQDHLSSGEDRQYLLWLLL